MALVFGRDVAVQDFVDGDYITVGCATSCSIEYINEIIGKTDANAGLFRKKRVRISDVRISIQGVLISESEPTRLSAWHFLQEAIRRSERTIRMVFTDELGNDKAITGLFIVSTQSLVADVNAFTDFDIQMEGTGGIAITEIAPPGEVVCPEWARDWWAVSSGNTVNGLGDAGLTFAGKELIAVFRSGAPLNETSGTPGNMEYSFDGTTITVDPTNPFNSGETVFVIWEDDGS